MTSVRVPPLAQAGLLASVQPRLALRAWPTNPSIAPPSMSAVALDCPCGPPPLTSAVSWNGRWQPPAGSRTQTVGTPPAIGIPSAPGYVPKYESNDRFSCMITTMCLIFCAASVASMAGPPGKGALADGGGAGFGPEVHAVRPMTTAAATSDQPLT